MSKITFVDNLASYSSENDFYKYKKIRIFSNKSEIYSFFYGDSSFTLKTENIYKQIFENFMGGIVSQVSDSLSLSTGNTLMSQEMSRSMFTSASPTMYDINCYMLSDDNPVKTLKTVVNFLKFCYPKGNGNPLKGLSSFTEWLVKKSNEVKQDEKHPLHFLGDILKHQSKLLDGSIKTKFLISPESSAYGNEYDIDVCGLIRFCKANIFNVSVNLDFNNLVYYNNIVYPYAYNFTISFAINKVVVNDEIQYAGNKIVLNGNK